MPGGGKRSKRNQERPAVRLSAAAPKQRTQEERSHETRSRLLEGTIHCLTRLGYANTTTTEIAKAAGVSRGAQLHHFPTKAELVAGAVERLFDLRQEEFIEAFRALPKALNPTSAAIDLLWANVSGPTFYAWLELVVASRTDTELSERLTEVGRRFHGRVAGTYRTLFPTDAASGPFAEDIPRFVIAFLQGLSLDRLSGTPDSTTLLAINVLKGLAALAMPNAFKEGTKS